MQGHVAYPHLADNPVTRLVAMLAELDALVLDEGTEWFQPSNLEITDLEVGNPAHNVIPAQGQGAHLDPLQRLPHRRRALPSVVTGIAARHGGTARPVISGEPFLTPPGRLPGHRRRGGEGGNGHQRRNPRPAAAPPTRGSSRISCPVIEFGLVNATMHKLDEAVAVDDLATLRRASTRRIALAALALCRLTLARTAV